MTSLTWYGHATWLISITGDQEHKILIDPFLNDNPASPVKSADVSVDTILVSHGHFDHVADAAEIANKNDATLVAVYEVATWFANNHGVKNTVGMNIGGQSKMDFGSVKMTQAIHSSELPRRCQAVGAPAGFVVTIGDKKIYFACDTALFSDMQLIGKMEIDLAVLPIGDLFTMGVEDSITAIEFINPKQVLPTHYNTWPPIDRIRRPGLNSFVPRPKQNQLYCSRGRLTNSERLNA